MTQKKVRKWPNEDQKDKGSDLFDTKSSEQPEVFVYPDVLVLCMCLFVFVFLSAAYLSGYPCLCLRLNSVRPNDDSASQILPTVRSVISLSPAAPAVTQ